MRYCGALTLVSVGALVGLEWLFTVTKASFLSASPWATKLSILATALLPFHIVGLVAMIGLYAFSTALRFRGLITMVLLPSVLLWAVLLVLLFDNFTNTILDFGIQKTTGGWRRGYALLFLAAFGGSIALTRRLFRTCVAHPRIFEGLAIVLLILPLVGIFAWTSPRSRQVERLTETFPIPNTAIQRPNILLLSSDGVSAKNMSVYGYERRTTPFLETLASKSLVCENAFANCARTTGSLISVLTGRWPTQTRVVFPPDVLRGDDAYLHLPGVLRHLGYRNLQISVRHFGDAYDLNVRNGFHSSTFQERLQVPFMFVANEETRIFVQQTVTRVRDRVQHVLGSSERVASIVEVEPSEQPNRFEEEAPLHHDEERLQALLEFIREENEPWFAQVHFMTTHGARFPIHRQVFSRGQRQDAPWLVDFYDDAILEFDRQVSVVFRELEKQNQLDNTVVVVYSDHGAAWDDRSRIPLLWVFPNGEHASRIRSNVQNVDIAPTILEYMGIEPPRWMIGHSLLRSPPERLRPVISADYDSDALEEDGFRAWMRPDSINPPFYTLREVTMIICQNAYTADLQNRDVAQTEIEGHTAPCLARELPTPRESIEWILRHLRDQGYDVSSLE